MPRLPDGLAPLIGSKPYLDVLGTTDPWVIPDGWFDEMAPQIASELKAAALAAAGAGEG